MVLDSGRVVGIWDLGKSDDPLSVKVAPLGRWPRKRWDDVAEQVDRIAAMLGTSKTKIERCKAPVNLLKAKRNRFLSPLGEA